MASSIINSDIAYTIQTNYFTVASARNAPGEINPTTAGIHILHQNLLRGGIIVHI